MKRVLRFAPAVIAIVVVSTIAIGEHYRTETTTHTRVEAGGTTPTGPSATKAGPGGAKTNSGSSTGAGVLPAVSGLDCAAGRNGGATDVGVTATSIKLRATKVTSGVGSSFLGEVPIAMEAVVNKINHDGGICGRLLDLKMVNDGWVAADGLRIIRTFIAEGAFALAVSPSSEGLDAAIRNDVISRAGIPVVGADGMLISQYTDPWVFPVAASTITAMHVMAKKAAADGAKTFGLVYDKSYHFGVEGASAFRGALKRLGGILKADVGIEAGQPSYKNDVDRFNTGCSPCDFVAMLLEPPTALKWIGDGAGFGKHTGGPQPLFVNSFARTCGSPCNGMQVWTGYHPPIYPFDDLPGVVAYVNDVHARSSTVDVNNPFVEGGYLGMKLLEQALRAAGPSLTRARLRAALDAITLDTGITRPLQWREGDHFANSAVHSFSIVVNAGSFSAWQSESDWIEDPWIGQDAPDR